MKTCCFLCKKKINHGEEYTSINKGNYSVEGDKDWIALIFHDACWSKLGKNVRGKIANIFQVEA
jgi:hypothetical protein